MQIRIFLYHITRVLFGIILVGSGAYNVINYSDFLERLDMYFMITTLFDFSFIEAFSPLVPFAEFMAGMFLVLGIFIRKTLLAISIAFGFFFLFFLDAQYISFACVHLFLCIAAVVLLKKDRYDPGSTYYNKDSYKVIR